jgi:hypothetical protein
MLSGEFTAVWRRGQFWGHGHTKPPFAGRSMGPVRSPEPSVNFRVPAAESVRIAPTILWRFPAEAASSWVVPAAPWAITTRSTGML